MPLIWKYSGTRWSNELRRFDIKIGHQDASSINSHQGDMPHFT